MWVGGFNRYEINKINFSIIFDKECICIYVYVFYLLKSSLYCLYNSSY